MSACLQDIAEAQTKSTSKFFLLHKATKVFALTRRLWLELSPGRLGYASSPGSNLRSVVPVGHFFFSLCHQPRWGAQRCRGRRLWIHGEGGEWTPEGLAIKGIMALPHIPYVWSHKYPPWGHKPPKQLRQQSEARHRHDACRSFSRISSTGRSRRKRRVCNICLRMQSRRHILRPDQRGRRSPSAIAHALIEKKLFSFMGAPT